MFDLILAKYLWKTGELQLYLTTMLSIDIATVFSFTTLGLCVAWQAQVFANVEVKWCVQSAQPK
jgi:hypothetical protein